ncbi:hypothetical protein FNV64_41920 [Streptomyces sp. S1A1-7]|nr:hypothetical protein FNV64_41920 [Streptomyces sp. S1A1-7]
MRAAAPRSRSRSASPWRSAPAGSMTWGWSGTWTPALWTGRSRGWSTNGDHSPDSLVPGGRCVNSAGASGSCPLPGRNRRAGGRAARLASRAVGLVLSASCRRPHAVGRGFGEGSGGLMGGESLTAAVRSGDVKAVTAILDAGGDPDAVDDRGTPALCLAVDGFDLATVEVLMRSARLDRVTDGQTPLLRAVDRGASDIVNALINHGGQLWHKDREGRDALTLARSWHETGAVAELRRRSGSAGTVRRETVRDEHGVSVEEVTLGGLTVRTGHSAILTALEPRYGIRTSFTELLSRALAEPDVDHEIWWVTTDVLQQRRDRVTWDMSAALRDRPDPRERYSGAEVLRLFNLFDYSDEAPFDAPLVDLFLPWAAREPDPRVLRPLTAGLSGALDPRAERPLHDLARHADSEVRGWAVFGLRYGVDAGRRDALATVLACTRDEAAEVRRGACAALVSAPADSEVSDALAACLTDETEEVRVTAAVQLALRDDSRGDEILAALDATDVEGPYFGQLYDVGRHRRKTDSAAPR